jgi:hypothetical protein
LGQGRSSASADLPRGQRQGDEHHPAERLQRVELLNDIVQQEPATALDPELMGSLAAIGIV